MKMDILWIEAIQNENPMAFKLSGKSMKPELRTCLLADLLTRLFAYIHIGAKLSCNGKKMIASIEVKCLEGSFLGKFGSQ